MKKLRNNAVTAVYLLLKKDGKILVGKRCNTGYHDGKYQVPAEVMLMQANFLEKQWLEKLKKKLA